MRAPGERVSRKAPWVRIPPSPPKALRKQCRFNSGGSFARQVQNHAGCGGEVDAELLRKLESEPGGEFGSGWYNLREHLDESGAAETAQPRQVREEAAVRRSLRAPPGH